LSRRRPFVAAFLLLILALAIYASALRDGFVWDDEALVLRDPLIRSWRLIWEGFQHFLFTDATASDFYRPLQRLSYTLDYAVFFLSPFGYHLFSILWHAAAAIAFFFFAEEFLARCRVDSERRLKTAFIAALIWVVHPVQSSAVIYVAGRADPMAATFGFLGLRFGLWLWRTRGNWKWAYGFAAGLCFLASALSKEIGLIFPFVWIVLALTERKRGPLLGAAGLTIAVSIAYLSLRLPAEHIAPPPQPVTPLLVRPIVTARAVSEYAGLIVFPWRLHMERDVETHPFGFSRESLNTAAWRELQTLLGLMLIAALLCALWRARRHRAIFVPLLLAIICYLPVSGLLSLNATVAEHWLYLPSAFLFLFGVEAAGSLGSRRVCVCLTIWLLFLSARTFVRAFDWKDQRTLLTRTIKQGGDSARMLINLGGLELSEGSLAAARQALQRALEKEPNNPLAQLNLAAVKMKERDFAGSRALLAKVTDPPELRARAEESLAVLENRETGQVNLMRLRLAARLGPPNWSIEQRYIKALSDCGRPDRAITELKTCLTVAPYRAESWLMMSELLRKIGRPNEAAVALAEAEANDVHLHDR
jgi:tetratricopeptide (TPR) repeat protein